jgi:hypothetical protein
MTSPSPDFTPQRSKDELQRRLRESLQRKRPRRLRLVVFSILVAAAIAGLLAWLLTPPSEPAPLACVAFEDLDVVGAQVTLQGCLEGPPGAAVSVSGKKMVFEVGPTLLLPGQKADAVSAVTGPHGECSCAWTFPAQTGEGPFILRQIGDKFRPGTEDGGRVFLRPSATPLCLVQIDGALTAAKDQAWRTENSEDISPMPGAAGALRSARERGYALVYLAVAADRPTLYQKMRGWVAYHSTAGAEPLPAGVVLGRFTLPGPDSEDLLWQKTAAVLAQRFALRKEGNTPGHVAIAGTIDAARQLHAAGMRTFYLADGEDLPADVRRVPGWEGVRRALEE